MDFSDLESFSTVFYGLGVPTVFFLVQYIRSRNAYKEREKNACRDIISITSKIIASEHIDLNMSVLIRLIKSKSREYEVNIDLSIIPIIFEDVVTKFLENEFIPAIEKNNLVHKVILLENDIFNENETKNAIISEKNPTWSKNTTLSTALFTIAFSIITIIVSFFFSYKLPFTLNIDILSTVISIFVTTLTLYFIFYFNLRTQTEYKELQLTEFQGRFFEDIVFSALKQIFPENKISKEISVISEKRIMRPDFVLEINNERIPVEVKVIKKFTKDPILQVINYMKALHSNKGLLITNSLVP